MTTANQIIDQALGVLGVKAPGVAASGNEAAQALERLNTMVDAWATESLYAIATQKVTFTLPASTGSATIGPGSDFDIDPRPVRLEEGSFFTVNGLDYPIESVDEPTYNAICLKAIAAFGPGYMYYEPTFPEGTVFFYPQSSDVISVTLICQIPVSAFADLVTSYDLAPGYRRALALSLAEEICSDYERQVTPATAKAAALSRRNIKRLNSKVPQLMLSSFYNRNAYVRAGGWMTRA